MSVVLQKHQPPPPRLKFSTTPVHLNVEFTIFMGGIGKKLSIKNWVLCDIARICFPEFRQQPSCSLGYSLLWNITRHHECLDEGAHAIPLDAFRQQISWLVTRMIYVYTYIYVCVYIYMLSNINFQHHVDLSLGTARQTLLYPSFDGYHSSMYDIRILYDSMW
jgi:hypothetical protein